RQDWQTAAQFELNPATSTPRQCAEFALLQSASLVQLGRDQPAAKTLSGAIWLMERHGLRSPIAGLPKHLVKSLVRISGVHADALNDGLTANIAWSYPAVIERITLTPSQAAVLAGLDSGLSTAAIASRHYLSVNTIKTHKRALYRKLGVTSRADALTRAREL